ncbi:unnamed protein product [Lactuca virosa]|uniref:FBD domain-containing protein n=1 Tax=Lactuca virosa TaxID=75947 RepID=A0AAU9NT85_9ASTR|nr:unnamed protein product [Lactuca virosa]
MANGFFNLPHAFEGFLNLEELLLHRFDFGGRLCGTKINLPRLKTLALITCTNVYNFNIKATKLQDLMVIDCPDAMLLSVRQFCIDSHFLKFFIAEKIPKLLPHAIYSLKCLRLSHYQLADLHQLHGALCLLRNSPNLETLSLFMTMVPRVDVGPASNHLESPNCLDCTLNRLQTVEITYLDGSKPEQLFIKLLLAHSPSLDKLTITPSEQTDAQKRFDIATDVMQFPRASPKAKIFYLNPKP